ncbi:MAG TPA: nitronate monooxygenase [Thermoanaerobaculia bacterium]|nr:nitronate monooxygenase [Thermoanaerobaculia bacterium]
MIPTLLLAPMGGGPGTVELAAAVCNAGGLGAFAGAYLTPAQLRVEIARLRVLTDRPFNVNLFAGGYHREPGRDPAPILRVMEEVHQALRIAPPELPEIPPDPFEEQLRVVLDAKPAVFSFTFGVPSDSAMRRLKEAGIFIIGTATSAREAELLIEAGVDTIVAQGAEAGAHRGTWVEEGMIPTLELVRLIKGKPVIASGGIMTRADVQAALQAGAVAVQMGTAFLLCPEAGTSTAYRRALEEARESVITRAFSGRAARGLRNAFVDRIAEREELILDFPAQNSLTRPMRAASAAQDNPEYLSLWAGTGAGRAREMPAGELVKELTSTTRGQKPFTPCGFE